MFVVFSRLSGETHFLNETAIWLLELLREPGWHSPEGLVEMAAADTDMPEAELQALLGDIWPTFLDGGLVLRRSGQTICT